MTLERLPFSLWKESAKKVNVGDKIEFQITPDDTAGMTVIHYRDVFETNPVIKFGFKLS